MKIVVENIKDDSREARFEVRYRSHGMHGMHDLIRFLAQKAAVYEAKHARPGSKSSHRARTKKENLSPVRQRLAVQVLIKNAVRVLHSLITDFALLTFNV
jgi:hypothetical protein